MTLKHQDKGAEDSGQCFHVPSPSRHSLSANLLAKYWTSQGFLADERDSCIPPENGGFDVRWVRFPKHPLLFTGVPTQSF